MKRAILLIYALIVIVVHTSSRILPIYYDHHYDEDFPKFDYISPNSPKMSSFTDCDMEILERVTNMSRTKLQGCIDKTGVESDDLTNIWRASRPRNIRVYPYTTEFDESASKVGSFLACIIETVIPGIQNPAKVITYFNSIDHSSGNEPANAVQANYLNCLQRSLRFNFCALHGEVMLCQISLLREANQQLMSQYSVKLHIN